MSREYRQVRPGFLEVRAAPDGTSGRIIADVMKYNVIDDYRTAFEPRCFSESLETRMPRILWSHNPNDPIGQWVDADDKPDRLRLAGALDLAMIDGTITPAVPSAHRAFAQLRSRTIDQFSVGFVRQGEIRNKLRQGVTSITKAQLDEASPVLVGSVPGAELVSIRSANPDLALFGRQRRLTFFPREIRSPALDAEREERVAGGQFAKGGGRVPGSATAKSGPVVPKAGGMKALDHALSTGLGAANRPRRQPVGTTTKTGPKHASGGGALSGNTPTAKAAARIEAKKQYADSLAKTASADAKKSKSELVDWNDRGKTKAAEALHEKYSGQVKASRKALEGKTGAERASAQAKHDHLEGKANGAYSMTAAATPTRAIASKDLKSYKLSAKRSMRGGDDWAIGRAEGAQEAFDLRFPAG